jgi:hypothetical protein
MPSFEFDIGEQSRIGARFIAHVRDEIQNALFSEKSARKITQQQIAEKVGTSRAVINRQIMGLENMTLRRVAEILWAIGWEPHFEARKIPAGENMHPATELLVTKEAGFKKFDPKLTAGEIKVPKVDAPIAKAA